MSHIAADILTVGEYLSSYRLRPASVQRNYQWDVENSQALLNDLLQAWHNTLGDELLAVEDVLVTNELGVISASSDDLVQDDETSPILDETEIQDAASAVYFLGPIVLEPDGGEACMIYDGLQRTTTLTILFSVLRDLIALHDQAVSEAIDRCINDENGKPNLVLDGRDATLARNIQPCGESLKTRRNFRQGRDIRARILQIARQYRLELTRLAPREQVDFFEFVRHHVVFCRLRVGGANLARQIFVTTNDRGLCLNQADVLKSQISTLAQSEACVEQILKRWKAVDEKFNDKADFVEFLSAIDVLERGKWSGAQGLTILGDHLLTQHHEDSLLEWLDRLELQARAWCAMFGLRDGKGQDPFDGDVRRLLVFRWEEWRPLALFYYAAYLKAEKKGDKRKIRTLRNRFNVLHRRCMAITLANISDSGRRTIFAKSLKWAKRGRNNNPNAPDGPLQLRPDQKSRVRQSLTEPLYEVHVYQQFAKWYECMLWGKDVPAYILGSTVEHVLPKAALQDSTWMSSFADERSRKRLAHLSGNLAVISHDDNQKAGRSDYAVKREIFEASDRPYKSLESVIEHKDWTPDTIELRTEQICDFVMSRLDVLDD